MSILPTLAQANAFIRSIPGGVAEFERLKAGNSAWKPEVWASEHFKSMESQGKNPTWPGGTPASTPAPAPAPAAPAAPAANWTRDTISTDLANAFIDSVGGGRAEFNRLQAANPGWKPEVWATEHFNSMQNQGKNPVWPSTTAPVPNLGNDMVETPFTPKKGLFDLPTLTKDIYPQSSSVSSSGLDWESGPGADLLTQLTAAIKGLPGQVANFGTTLQDQYSNLMRKALGPQAFQGTLNNLANRGMLRSTEGSNALSTTAENIMNTVGDRQYESTLQGLLQQMQMPGLLGELSKLLQRTDSTSSSTNPLAPYQWAGQYY